MSDPKQPENDELSEAAVSGTQEDNTVTGEEQASAPAVDVDALQARLVMAEKEATEATARAQAEVHNLRKRLERDKDNAVKFAVERLSLELLAVVDSLQHSLEALSADDVALKGAREGSELTLKLLLDIFAKFNIEQIDPIGAPFDPNEHEALTMVPNPDMEPNSVMKVIQPGYRLHERVIRPARVVVSKAP